MANTRLATKKIVVVGGGTGTAVVLKGLKQYAQLDLTAIVTVADSGGSTGRLRDEFGFLPVGDIRQCLAALAHGSQEERIREMLLYRFKKGNKIAGHNLGNLILTALENLYASPAKAVEVASQLFRIRGKVFPITTKDVHLVIEYQDGTVLLGEHHLDDPKHGGKPIARIALSPQATIYQKARQALVQADMIVLGPGDLYASLLVNTLARGFKAALQRSQATFVYMVNLMTHYSQTHTMTAQQHLEAVIRYCGRKPDVVVLNSQVVSPALLGKYQKNREYLVEDDIPTSNLFRILRQPLLTHTQTQLIAQDSVPRSLLRHDSDKVAKVLIQLL